MQHLLLWAAAFVLTLSYAWLVMEVPFSGLCVLVAFLTCFWAGHTYGIQRRQASSCEGKVPSLPVAGSQQQAEQKRIPRQRVSKKQQQTPELDACEHQTIRRDQNQDRKRLGREGTRRIQETSTSKSVSRRWRRAHQVAKAAADEALEASIARTAHEREVEGSRKSRGFRGMLSRRRRSSSKNSLSSRRSSRSESSRHSTKDTPSPLPPLSAMPSPSPPRHPDSHYRSDSQLCVATESVSQGLVWSTLSEQQKGLVLALERELWPDVEGNSVLAPFFASKLTYVRYLRARQWDLTKAQDMLQASIRWRNQIIPQNVKCWACQSNRTSHNMRVIGFDSSSMPVIYTCFAQASNRFDSEANMAHMTQLMEGTEALMREVEEQWGGVWRTASEQRASSTSAITPSPPSAPREKRSPNINQQWVWVIDFHGYSFRDSNPMVAVQTVHLLSHYPERLGRCVLLGTPTLFSGCWHLIKPLLGKTTVDKVNFVVIKELLKSTGEDLCLGFGPELQSWLQEECKDNRLRKQAKEYWTCEPNGHDTRGPAHWVQSSFYKELDEQQASDL